MRLRLAYALLILTCVPGCVNQQASAPTPTPTPTPTPAAVTHSYNGTASVGDFLTIVVNSTASTIAYTNLSNGDTGTLNYTTNTDGSYAITDPSGNLISAYEVPGYALVVQSAKSGPNHNSPALITAVESGPISLSTFGGKSYNYLQFRTAAGGLEVGSVTIGATSGTDSSYWPYGSFNQQGNGPFNNGSLDFSGATESASGTYLSLADAGGSTGTDYVFGTANGYFVVDTPNGSIIGLQKAASPAFDPSVAGTYSGVFYEKANANTGIGNVETGTASTSQATIVVTAAANITVTDSKGNTVINAPLTPVASSSYLYDGTAGKLSDPCNGLFTFRAVTGSYERDVFVTFVGNSVVFAKFSANLPWTNSSGYSYWYGVGIK